MALKDKKTKLFESRKEKIRGTEEMTPLEEIAELEKKITEKKKVIVEKEAPKEVKEKLEEIRQIELEKIEGLEKEQPSGKVPPISPPISDDLKKIKKLDKDNQIKTLIKLTFEKNLAYAVKVARNFDNPYILDEFHDTLIDEYYKELVKKRKLKEA